MEEIDDVTLVDLNQYLTFTLEDEIFALQIAKVREVLDYTSITKVPRMPRFLRGVINLRGIVVPVIDLRLILGLPPTERTVDTCIIIADVVVEDDVVQLGALADSVREVVDIDPDQIQPPMKLGSQLDTTFITGIGQYNSSFVIILDIDTVLSSAEKKTVRNVHSQYAGDDEVKTGKTVAVS